jgi:hypothetical protein
MTDLIRSKESGCVTTWGPNTVWNDPAAALDRFVGRAIVSTWPETREGNDVMAIRGTLWLGNGRTDAPLKVNSL